MDYLERYQAEQEERQAAIARQRAPRADDGPHTDMRSEDYPVTIIGCIRGRDGWYRAGFDEKTKTIKPIEKTT